MMLTSLASHLWQSTLFAVVAGLLTLTMRQERARVRYWLWLAASVKFLVPFEGLSVMGSRFASVSGIAIASGHRFYDAIEVVAGRASAVVIPDFAGRAAMVAGVWCLGFAAVIIWWWVRWRKILRTIRGAARFQQGREVEMLRRIEGKVGVPRPLEIMQSADATEPGVFGIAAPILLWPEGISNDLADAELEAILTHEVRHMQRRDNLTAAIQMMVEALFWFHPLVWWLGGQLVAERERACDEDVLALGNEPRVYATGILKVCEFCLQAPLPCMSGVSGGDLKKRMVWIMTNRAVQELGIGKKLMMGVLSLASVAGPVAVGLVHASPPGRRSDARSVTVAVSDQGAEHASVQASKQEMMGLIVKKVNPQYPEAAKKAHIQGEVVLRATIDTKGNVENLQVVSGPTELAPAAVEAVKQWKYRPYKKGGRAVEVDTDITINFTLME
jgi:TonB family protein